MLLSDLDDWSELLPICPYKNSVYYINGFVTLISSCKYISTTRKYCDTSIHNKKQQKWNTRRNSRNARSFGR